MKHNLSDRDLHQFFREMKEIDAALPTPTYPVKAERRWRKLWMPAAAAAMLAITWLIWPGQENYYENPVDLIVITLGEMNQEQQKITIEEITYLDVWESPTESLLVDFDQNHINF